LVGEDECFFSLEGGGAGFGGHRIANKVFFVEFGGVLDGVLMKGPMNWM
jgi:hypothetical protein